MAENEARLRAFSYVIADKAALYRAIMRVFTDAKERFGLSLRPAEVAAALPTVELPDVVTPTDATADEVDAALERLLDWRNLTRDKDVTEVATVEEFYRPRYLYQLSEQGEAAERALAVFHDTLARPGELQAAALGDIRELLGELAQLAAADPVDAAKVHRTLTTLRARFDELTAKAAQFIASLQRTIDLHGAEVDAFLAYKDTLIDYLERFIGELVVATADIAATIARVEQAGVDRLLQAAAQRDLADALNPTDHDRADALGRWRGRWAGLRGWFVGSAAEPSQAEVLRARARSAIPGLLAAVAALNDRRVTRSDRPADLRALARWFAETDTDADAHRLWRAAFGLASARHLQVDDATLDARDAAPEPPSTSWLGAAPVRVAPRLRATGRHTPRGRPQSVIDRSEEKRLLAAAAEAEAAQTAAAAARLATGAPVRLSQLGQLDPVEFGLFLDLLGETLAAKVRPTDIAETTSADGTLHVTLAPTGDGARAVVATRWGRLSGPDHWLTIRRLHADQPQAGRVLVGAPA